MSRGTPRPRPGSQSPTKGMIFGVGTEGQGTSPSAHGAGPDPGRGCLPGASGYNQRGGRRRSGSPPRSILEKEPDMSEREAGGGLTEPRRQEVFLALVDAQDHDMTVAH